MKRLARLAFWVYALALFAATHWPNLRIESSHIPRPDIFIHMAVFGGWVLLLIATGYLAPGSDDPLAESRGVRGWLRLVTRPHAVLLAMFVALAYAAFDELTQGVPGLGRTVAWDDYLANSAGIMLGVALAALVPRFRGFSARA